MNKSNEFGKIIIEGYTDRGKRVVNQDTLLFEGELLQQTSSITLKKRSEHIVGSLPFVCAVADGVSNAFHSEVASYKALEVLRDWFSKPCFDPEMPLMDFILQGFQRANDAVIEYARDKLSSTGTTLTMLLIVGNRYWLSNVGDSPAFLIRDGSLQEIGARQNSETVFLGEYHSDTLIDKIHITSDDCCLGDVFLLCSDGLTDVLSEEQLVDVAKVGEREKFIPNLKTWLQKDPPNDNCSVLRVELLAADTKFMRSRADEIESTSQLMQLLEEPDTKFLRWSDMVRTMSPYARSKCVSRIHNDWGVEPKTARSWLDKLPARYKVLKLCWSLEFTEPKVKRALTHFAPYSWLDPNDPKDVAWQKLFSANRSDISAAGGPEAFLSAVSNDTIISEENACRWQVLGRKIHKRWKVSKITADKSWRKASARNKVNTEFRGTATADQKMGRFFLIAVALREARSLEMLNEDLLLNGMTELGRRSIFELTLRSILEDIKLNNAEIFTDQGEEAWRFHSSQNLHSGLVEEVLARLNSARDLITEPEWKDAFDEEFISLQKYL